MSRDVVTSRFHPGASSVAQARRFVTDAVVPAHPELADTVALLVSELATNAVRHGGTELVVAVEVTPAGVRVAVTDRGSGKPAPRYPGPGELHGRGLQIVRAIADAWGVEPIDPPPGKEVWFEVSSLGH